jgi:hypothetical protein
VIIFTDRQGFELFDGGERPFDILRVLGVIGRAGAIRRAPFRGRPFFLERLVARRPRQGLREGRAGERNQDCACE